MEVSRHPPGGVRESARFLQATVHWRQGAENHDRPIGQASSYHLARLGLIFLHLHLPNVIAAKHEKHDLGTQSSEPIVDVLVGPSNRHRTVVAKLRPFP